MTSTLASKISRISPTGIRALAIARSVTSDPSFAEGLERSKRITESGAREIINFMNVFDLQLAVLRQQRPSPTLQGLVDKIKESIRKAETYLRRDKPYGIADAQWQSLQEIIPSAEETVQRYESAIEEMRDLEESERRVQQIAAEAEAPLPVLPGEVPAEAPGEERLLPDSPIPERRFPVGLVVGGAVVASLGVGAWLIFGGKD